MKSWNAQFAESVSPQFSEDEFIKVRNHTRAVVKTIASNIHPGMLEEEAVDMAKKVMRNEGMHRSWHPTRIRFGKNTTIPTWAPSAPGVILQENDIFSVHISPIVGIWEGDAAETFVVGHDLDFKRCAMDAKEIFHEVRKLWQRETLTGKALYAFSEQCAKERGWELRVDMPGHRVSDYPHAAFYMGSLANHSYRVSPSRWSFEVQIQDASNSYGAFFDDLLLEDKHYDA